MPVDGAVDEGAIHQGSKASLQERQDRVRSRSEAGEKEIKCSNDLVTLIF